MLIRYVGRFSVQPQKWRNCWVGAHMMPGGTGPRNVTMLKDSGLHGKLETNC